MQTPKNYGLAPVTLKLQRTILQSGAVDIPSNITQIYAIVIGGGGGGYHGGGGGAAVVHGWTTPLTNATIGAGGQPGYNGAATYYGGLVAFGGGAGTYLYASQSGGNGLGSAGGGGATYYYFTGVDYQPYSGGYSTQLMYQIGAAGGYFDGIYPGAYSGSSTKNGGGGGGGGASSGWNYPYGNHYGGWGGSGLTGGGGGAAINSGGYYVYLLAGTGGNSRNYSGGQPGTPALTDFYNYGVSAGGGAGFLAPGKNAYDYAASFPGPSYFYGSMYGTGGEGGLGGGGGGTFAKGGDGAVLLYW